MRSMFSVGVLGWSAAAFAARGFLCLGEREPGAAECSSARARRLQGGNLAASEDMGVFFN